jgi:hypothetical protein
MPYTINRDQVITVEFKLKVPAECNEDQLQEWLEFELNANGSMKHSPLSESGLEAESFSVRWR